MSGVGGELEGFEVEGQVADDGMMEAFGAGAVELDVVGGPADAELVAACRQFADEVGEPLVVWVASGGGAQDGDGVVGDGVPVDEELSGVRAEEQEPCAVDRSRGKVEDRRVQRFAEAVGGEDVEAFVAHVGRGGDRVEDLLHAGADSFLCRLTSRCVGGRRGADEVEQVGAFCLVEVQGAGDAFEHVVGDTVGVAALEAGVVLDADPGEHRHFLAAQALDAPVRAVDGESGLLRGDLGATGGEELADAVFVVHDVHVTT